MQDGRNWARIEADHHTGALFDVGGEGEADQLCVRSPQVGITRGSAPCGAAGGSALPEGGLASLLSPSAWLELTEPQPSPATA